MGVKEAEKIGDTEIRIRGVTANKGPLVPRGFLQVASVKPPVIPGDRSGREELAAWLVEPGNPLTPRVYANRVWHWLTGVGLVRTVDNFGSTGERPSHPELLDWLAARLRDGGWSTRQIIRDIVLSSTYQQRSDAVAGVGIADRRIELDPENRLFWRMNRRRLPAEAIRDGMLVASGQLNRDLGGPNIKEGTTIEYGYKFDDTRRSLYTPVFRNTLLELFESFDFADPNMVAGRRNTSTTATQGLYLMNHPFTMEQATEAARQTLALPDMDDAQHIHHAYVIALGRRATERELNLAMNHITLPTEDNTSAGRREQAWAGLYQALFASIDFRYID